MPLPLPRLALLTCCLLPAVGVSVPAHHANIVATFIYSCDASDPAPRLRTTYTAPGKPRPRPKGASVEVFEEGKAPARKYVRIGEVNVLASGSRTSVDELTDWARRGARQLGGDAIVNMTCDDAAHAQPKAGPVGLLYLTATVVSWEQ
jgi:uncharacterized protein YbjQ (UPF0145 family)